MHLCLKFCSLIHKELSHVAQMSLGFIAEFSLFGVNNISAELSSRIIAFQPEMLVKMTEFVSFGRKYLVLGWLTEFFVN